MGIRSIFWKVISGRAPENGWIDSVLVDHFEPYTPAQISKNFTATVADEISVTRGTTVKALYRDDQWIYVQVSDGRRGFVPQTYCKLLITTDMRNQTMKRQDKIKKPINITNSSLEKRWEKSNLQQFIDSLPVQKDEGEAFEMEPKCDVIVLQSFKAVANDDMDVSEKEIVTVLNCADPDWTYVKNCKNDVGFVPASYLKIPNDVLLLAQNSSVKKDKWENENLLVVESFTGRTNLDLSVRPGEWIKCTGRPVDDWLWAQRTSDKKQGFIPVKVVILATDL